MTVTEEFAELLAALGLGDYHADGSLGGDVFLVNMPQSPDAAVAVNRYGGPESDSKLGYDRPSIQVRVRAPAGDVRTAEARAQGIYDALHGMSSRELPGGTWLVLLVGTQGGPIPLGQDNLNRDEWTINFRAELRRQTANRD